MKNYTVKEVAESIGVSEITVKRHIKCGGLRAYKEKNKLFITEDDFNTFLETHPRYSRKVQRHHSAQDAVVDVITANEVFNVYVEYLKKLMSLPKEDISSILPILENHRLLLDMSIDRLKKGE